MSFSFLISRILLLEIVLAPLIQILLLLILIGYIWKRKAYKLEDVYVILDRELDKFSRRNHVGDADKQKLLLKVKEKCEHGLVMLKGREGGYKALTEEFEKEMKTEKEQAEQKLKAAKDKHREEKQKLEEEMRLLKENYEKMRWN